MEGLHELTIEVYTVSGTGSLADEFGVEGICILQYLETGYPEYL